MASEKIQKYFDEITSNVSKAYAMAELARSKGIDPVNHVEIPLAKNMAERVIGLVSALAPQLRNTTIVPRIQELETKYGKGDWKVAFKIAEEVAAENFCKFSDKRESLEVGMRVGFGYITNGIVSSPLEGFTGLKLKNRLDGKGEYFALYFSGPIRSAGTTAICVFVALADYIRIKNGFMEYDPTNEEIKRMSIELADFHERITNLQYFPSSQETELMTELLPVQIDGDPSEKLDVSNYKDLPRIETNRLRSGVCLTMGEGLCQKSAKFYGKFSKWMDDFGMGHWKFLDRFIRTQKDIKAKLKEKISKDDGVLIKPDYTFIKDIVAGRPVITYPLRVGGLRLRYGKSRNTGLSGTALHPATMKVLNDYIAIGTQLKVERPGKATVVSACDSIEGPIVKLNNGNVVFLDTYEKALQYYKDVDEIIFLGDILINYGDFLDRAHVLATPGYCEEWWLQELKSAIGDKDTNEIARHLNLEPNFIKTLLKDFTTKVDAASAIEISLKLNIPLHPRWTYHWKDISKEQLILLVEWLKKKAERNNDIIIPLDGLDLSKDPKRVLELLGIPHKLVKDEYVIIEKDEAKALLFTLNNLNDFKADKESSLEIINDNCKAIIKDKSGIFIGARMGRPEKAKIRKLKGSPHALFPVGVEGGKLRSFQSSLEKSKVTADFSMYNCEKCNQETVYPICHKCNSKTTYLEKSSKISLPIDEYFKNVASILGTRHIPDLIKGIRGTSNQEHIPEHLAKGVLRALHGIYVNKDGTMRYDMTEIPLTAFKSKEIGTSVEKLRQLGYEKDIYGNELVDENQVLELMAQDIVLPSCQDSIEEGADEILFRTCSFIDDLLIRLYKLEPFYNLKSKKDLAGHLVIALAPHISAGTVARVIGFSKSQGFYAHPLMHCAIRRDADGDEGAIMLLLDALINFSRKYLSSHRGSTQDAPLVLTSILNPSEVDDMVFNLDMVDSYPLEFYQACEKLKWPWEVKIETLRDNLGTDKQYEGFKFTHPVSDINNGILCSAYKSIPSMQDKVLGQINIAEKLRAVDAADVARLVIDRHFIRDIKGNLRKFSTQEFRCVSCNEKYRRPPLIGVCLKCNGKLLFTVSEGSVIKYLSPCMSLVERFHLPPYLKQNLELTKLRIESVFGKDAEKQEGLGKWFG